MKMSSGIRSLLETVAKAIPQVGNLGMLFALLFFIFAALGVELFGELDCNSGTNPCEAFNRHASFVNFGIALLTLFRISTGDNWNGILKDTLRCEPHEDCTVIHVLSPVYFVVFVMMAQFVLVNVVVAVLMKQLEDSRAENDEVFETGDTPLDDYPPCVVIQDEDMVAQSLLRSDYDNDDVIEAAEDEVTEDNDDQSSHSDDMRVGDIKTTESFESSMPPGGANTIPCFHDDDDVSEIDDRGRLSRQRNIECNMSSQPLRPSVQALSLPCLQPYFTPSSGLIVSTPANKMVGCSRSAGTSPFHSPCTSTMSSPSSNTYLQFPALNRKSRLPSLMTSHPTAANDDANNDDAEQAQRSDPLPPQLVIRPATPNAVSPQSLFGDEAPHVVVTDGKSEQAAAKRSTERRWTLSVVKMAEEENVGVKKREVRRCRSNHLPELPRTPDPFRRLSMPRLAQSQENWMRFDCDDDREVES